MELRVNLTIRAEIEAAVALMQTLLGEEKVLPPFTQAGAESTDAAPEAASSAPIMMTFGAASVAPAVSADVDKNGLPWDERIHSSTRSKLVTGEWKLKRGVPPEAVAEVEAQLRGAGSPSPSVEVVNPGWLSSAAAHATTVAAPLAHPGAHATTPAASAVVTTAPAAATGDAPATFEQLMPRLTAAVVATILPQTAVNDVCAEVGLPSIVALQQMPQFVPAVWAILKNKYPGLV